MADWGGFSEAELRHLRSGGDVAANEKGRANGSATGGGGGGAKNGTGGAKGLGAVKKSSKSKVNVLPR